jgi:hypothetical protein
MVVEWGSVVGDSEPFCQNVMALVQPIKVKVMQPGRFNDK